MRGIIYSITCKLPGINHEYIGSTINFSRRMKEHKRCSKYKNRKIYNIIRKEGGWKKWECTIIDIDNYKTDSELREKEYRLINVFKPDMNTIVS